MKARAIKLVIAKKFAKFLQSIEDVELRKLIEQNTIVTGGCIVSLLQNENVNDFDIYFRTKECAFKVADYFVRLFKANPPCTFKDTQGKLTVDVSVESLQDRIRIKVKSAGIAGEIGSDNYQYFETLPVIQQDEAQNEFVEDVMKNATDNAEDLDNESSDNLKDKKVKKYRPIFITSNAITLTNKIQIVTRFFGEPDQIHENYDFVHCTNYWKSWDKELVLRSEALEAILTKDLRYVGSKFPICSMIRARKFIQRGWTINAGQLLKMAFQISKLDLNNLQVLEEQLIGVDAAYFRQLIEVLQKKDPVNVDGTYLMTVIDKIF